MNSFGWISRIAENRIQEAMEKGEFDNLPGMGKKLVFENTDHVPPELRMAYKILKNAGAIPPELSRRQEMGRLADMLDNCPDEQEKIKCMRKLRMMFLSRPERLCAIEEKDEYLQRILMKLERNERKYSGKKE